jgi:hypothetical protein
MAWRPSDTTAARSPASCLLLRGGAPTGTSRATPTTTGRRRLTATRWSWRRSACGTTQVRGGVRAWQRAPLCVPCLRAPATAGACMHRLRTHLGPPPPPPPPCHPAPSGDGYVHRLIQSKTDGKLVEVPSPAPTCPHGMPSPHHHRHRCHRHRHLRGSRSSGGGADARSALGRSRSGSSAAAAYTGAAAATARGAGAGSSAAGWGDDDDDDDGDDDGVYGGGGYGAGGCPVCADEQAQMKEALVTSKLEVVTLEYNHLLARCACACAVCGCVWRVRGFEGTWMADAMLVVVPAHVPCCSQCCCQHACARATPAPTTHTHTLAVSWTASGSTLRACWRSRTPSSRRRLRQPRRQRSRRRPPARPRRRRQGRASAGGSSWSASSCVVLAGCGGCRVCAACCGLGVAPCTRGHALRSVPRLPCTPLRVRPAGRPDGQCDQGQ